jgi:peptide/nickel transport system permease protein
MLALIVRRLGSLLLTLLLLSLITFAITAVLPGNVATMILGPYATPEALATLERQLGLGRPLWQQYFDWLGGFVIGDWGVSLRSGQPVRDLLLFRLANSLYLAGAAMLLISTVGIGLGIVAAIRRNSWLDNLIGVVAFVGISTPAFVSGSLLIVLVGGGVWRLLPGSGYVEPTRDVAAWAAHLVLPTITLTFMILAYVVRMLRASLIEALQSNYIRTARLKGLPERTVVWKHALRNALLPTITVIAMNLSWLIGSVVIVEQVFAYPGMGDLIVFAVHNRDVPVLQAAVLVVGAVTGIGNLAADLLYAVLNPRVRYG